jgi:hypothetical protein
VRVPPGDFLLEDVDDLAAMLVQLGRHVPARKWVDGLEPDPGGFAGVM